MVILAIRDCVGESGGPEFESSLRKILSEIMEII